MSACPHIDYHCPLPQQLPPPFHTARLQPLFRSKPDFTSSLTCFLVSPVHQPPSPVICHTLSFSADDHCGILLIFLRFSLFVCDSSVHLSQLSYVDNGGEEHPIFDLPVLTSGMTRSHSHQNKSIREKLENSCDAEEPVRQLREATGIACHAYWRQSSFIRSQQMEGMGLSAV